MRFKPDIAILIGGMLLAGTPLWAQSIYDETSRGATCTSDPKGLRYCTYSVGALEIGLAGVGSGDTTVHFFHSDSGDDYYAQLYVEDGCIVVMPGAKTGPDEGKAFVSVKTGNVLKTVEECRSGSSIMPFHGR
jgi:hypothetical protein